MTRMATHSAPNDHPVAPMPRTTPFRRLYTEDIDSTSYPSLAIAIGEPQDSMITLRGNIGAEFMFFGQGNDNTQIDYQLYVIRQLARKFDMSREPDAPLFEPVLYCSGTATLSATTGADDSDQAGYVGADYRFADTVTKTLAAYGTYVEAMMDRGSEVYSPADDTNRAVLGIPDLMSHAGYVMLLKRGASSPATVANALHREFA